MLRARPQLQRDAGAGDEIAQPSAFMSDPAAAAPDALLSAALTRYLASARNRGHYERADPGVAADAPAYAAELVRMRREEIATWRRTWWRRLAGEPMRVLDAGCGPGFVTAALADELPHSMVVGIDVEPEAIAVAQLVGSARPNLSAVHGALEDLPPAIGSFDLIVCRTTLEHVYEPCTALAQLLDALAPGGALFLETPNYLFPFEPHVRLLMAPKSPKWLLRAECRLFGRDPAFVDHLQFACDPRTLSRWARAHGPFDVVDLMAEKVLAVLHGEQRSAVGWRQRAAEAAGGLARRRPRLAERIARMPVWPSVQLLIIRGFIDTSRGWRAAPQPQ
jgi:2-polyprenyl-3-methyl-5-hydroxy-6-metoxy-1,4-benzoquinol methylase